MDVDQTPCHGGGWKGRLHGLHYNGEGELSKRMAPAKSKLETLHYKNKRSMSFEQCTKIMTKWFNTLHKDIN
jgi:hypothetical protein